MRRSLLFAPLLRASLFGASPARAQTEVSPSLLDQGTRLLASLLRTARDAAFANGVRPVPPRVYGALLGFFPDTLLRKVRYASDHAEPITLPGLAMTYGHIDAITLIDVILFHDDHAARHDAKLWAHELTHVMQYERWGVEGFARRYLEDSEAVEKEARDNADRWVSWSEHAHL